MGKEKILVIGRFHSQVRLQAQSHKLFDVQFCSNWNSDVVDGATVRGLIIRSKTKVDEKFLSFFPNLQVIITATSGFDHISLPICQKNNIAVAHVPEAPVQAVAELVFLKILAAARKQNRIYQQMAQGDWDRRTLVGSEISGRTLGIVGCGRIGRRVAQMAQAFALGVQAYDPFIEEGPKGVNMVGYDELLRTSDILSFHVPKTTRTRHMLNRGTLAGVSSQAIIVNTCRGEVVNEGDLISFLRENPEASAALDVFEHEPLSLESPLNSLENAVLSPHIGASTDQCLYQSSFQAMTSMEKFFQTDGSMPNTLPPSVAWWEDERS